MRFDSSPTTMKYTTKELRETISKLRILKHFAGGLCDKGEIQLTMCEVLLEHKLNTNKVG